jgi:hypothetical protein
MTHRQRVWLGILGLALAAAMVAACVVWQP